MLSHSTLSWPPTNAQHWCAQDVHSASIMRKSCAHPVSIECEAWAKHNMHAECLATCRANGACSHQASRARRTCTCCAVGFRSAPGGVGRAAERKCSEQPHAKLQRAGRCWVVPIAARCIFVPPEFLLYTSAFWHFLYMDRCCSSFSWRHAYCNSGTTQRAPR